ncbi:MAG: hypothetical protein ACTHM2_06530 [Afipia sp.]
MEREFYVSRTADQNGERHRWLLVDAPEGRSVQQKSFVDAVSRAGTSEHTRRTASYEIGEFLTGDHDRKAKAALQALLQIQ